MEMFNFCIEGDALKALIRVIDNDGLKILAIFVSVFMGFVAILLNNYYARKREDKKRRIEKIEELYIASIEYTEAVNELFSEYFRLKKQRYQSNVTFPDVSGRYSDEDKADIKPFRLTVHKLEMLFGLYFKEIDFDVDTYNLKSLPVVAQMLNDWSPHTPPGYSSMEDLCGTTRNNINDNTNKLISICHDLMAGK